MYFEDSAEAARTIGRYRSGRMVRNLLPHPVHGIAKGNFDSVWCVPSKIRTVSPLKRPEGTVPSAVTQKSLSWNLEPELWLITCCITAALNHSSDVHSSRGVGAFQAFQVIFRSVRRAAHAALAFALNHGRKRSHW